jgi:hypothetical protein
VSDEQADSFTFDSSTLGIDADSGTYNDCGVAFLAPATGRVLVLFDADLDNSGTQFTVMAPVLRSGDVVGSGTNLGDADPEHSVYTSGDRLRMGSHWLVEGLTPGDPYNVRLEHRTTGGATTGTILRRSVTVMPAP